MSLHATCPHCKSEFEFGDDYAGRLLLCRHCNSTYSVPELPAEPRGGEPAAQPMMPAARPARAGPPPRDTYLDRMTAGRLCAFLGVICILGALVAGAFAIFFGCQTPPAKLQAFWNMLLMILGCCAGGCVVEAAIYLICGSAIRDGGIISAWMILLLTAIQLLASLWGVGLQVMHYGDIPEHFAGNKSVDPHTVYWTTVIVGSVFLLVHAKLFACLVRIVSTPRQRRERLALHRPDFA